MMIDCDNCKKAHCHGYVRCRLVGMQTTIELERKANKAKGRRWSQEEIDLAERRCGDLFELFGW
jgi:hypothetical protein